MVQPVMLIRHPQALAMPATPESHSARYFALLYSAAPERPVLEALFGIEHEVFDSLRAGLDHNVAHSRLQWWREECERAANGRPVHPLTKALVIALSAAASLDGTVASFDGAARRSSPPVPAADAGLDGQPQAVGLYGLVGLCGIVDVAVWDLAGATFETRRELDAYCERWATGMIGPLVAPPPASPPASTAPATRTTDWRALGAAMREIELLNELAREAHHGRIRVPLDELERANVDTSALARPPWPDPLVEQLRARHKSLRNNISRILIDVDREQQPALRGLLVWASLAWRSSQRAERALPDRLRPGRFDAISDAWFAWRIARQATIGRFRLN
jgi:phytoene synthase